MPGPRRSRRLQESSDKYESPLSEMSCRVKFHKLVQDSDKDEESLELEMEDTSKEEWKLGEGEKSEESEKSGEEEKTPEKCTPRKKAKLDEASQLSSRFSSNSPQPTTNVCNENNNVHVYKEPAKVLSESKASVKEIGVDVSKFAFDEEPEMTQNRGNSTKNQTQFVSTSKQDSSPISSSPAPGSSWTEISVATLTNKVLPRVTITRAGQQEVAVGSRQSSVESLELSDNTAPGELFSVNPGVKVGTGREDIGSGMMEEKSPVSKHLLANKQVSISRVNPEASNVKEDLLTSTKHPPQVSISCVPVFIDLSNDDDIIEIDEDEVPEVKNEVIGVKVSQKAGAGTNVKSEVGTNVKSEVGTNVKSEVGTNVKRVKMESSETERKARDLGIQLRGRGMRQQSSMMGRGIKGRVRMVSQSSLMPRYPAGDHFSPVGRTVMSGVKALLPGVRALPPRGRAMSYPMRGMGYGRGVMRSPVGRMMGGSWNSRGGRMIPGPGVQIISPSQQLNQRGRGRPPMMASMPTRGRLNMSNPRVGISLVIPASDDDKQEFKIELNKSQVEALKKSLKD